MATENLKVKITADASQAKAEIGKFKNQLKQTTSEASASTSKFGALKTTLNGVQDSAKGSIASMSGLSSSLGGVSVAVGALVAGLKLAKRYIEAVIQAAEVGDKIKDESQKVFLSTTAYQEWGYVLKQNGVELSALKMAMRQFSQRVASGDEALKKYGITASNIDEAFEQAVFAIQNLGTETEKVAAATELFGTRALELFPVLNQTNAETQGLMDTYRAMGATLSNEFVAASDTCSDSILQLKMAMAGFGQLQARQVIPIITKVVQWLTLLIAKVRMVIAFITGVKETFGGNGNTKTSLPKTTGSVATNTGNTAKNLGKAVKHAKQLRRTLMGIDELTKLIEKSTSSASSGSGGGGGGGVSVGGISDEDISGYTALADLMDSDLLKKLEEFKDKLENSKILQWITTMREKWQEFCDLWRDWLSTGWENIQGFFENLGTNMGDIRDKAKEAWALFKENVEAKIGVKIPSWDDIKTAWNKLVGNFQGKGASISIKIPTWDSLKKKWETLKKKFKGKTVSIGLKFSAAASDLKSWVNKNVIDKVNNQFKKVPILKNHLIPHLASGGILTAPTTALLGEYPGARQNPEIATPQSLMYETIQKAHGDLVTAFASMTRQVIAAIEDKDLSVQIGDEQVARSAQRGNTSYYNRTGKALLTI